MPSEAKSESGSETGMSYTAGADNAAWTSLGLARLSPYMFDHFSSISLAIEDEGSFETLVDC
jgi:hypothetical protein